MDTQKFKKEYTDTEKNIIKLINDVLNTRETITVNIVLDPSVKAMPSYAHDGDAGVDLVPVDCNYNAEYDYFEYSFGIRTEIPKGYVGLMFPRSSNSKTDAYLCNGVGVIDPIYRGDYKARFKNRDKANNKQPYLLTGNPIVQLIILPYPTIKFVEVNDLNETERGQGGFGSTNKK